ncbi:D-glucuronyl C5-epimerase family protein [Streptomyces sp. NPDC015131]|uniref:D-glucuronyl C5-epimerase family protein n=1 Tax=Streptomyces sp. NPDC015131 TaxID=3364941 RepID=UPI0036FB0A28
MGRQAPGEVAVAAGGLPFAFAVRGFRPVLDVPDAMRPWRDRVAAREDTGTRDADGVRMFRWEGREHDHPVGQIQWGLENLAAHRRTGDGFFLDRARAQADRVVARRHERRGAWFFPYPFDFTHGTHSGIAYRAPWYSGMAQGEALSLFSQLAQVREVPEEARRAYRRAADGAFRSLTADDGGTPWVVARDEDRHLWIHEYPVDPPGTSDFTYNGFMFAALGLWDYWALTRDRRAADLFDGSLTTLTAEFPHLRNPRWLSRYCRTHGLPTGSYHPVHVALLRRLSWLSGSEQLAAQSDLLADDFPPPSLGPDGGRVHLAEGTHTLLRYDDDGHVTATRTLDLRAPAGATASHRTRIKGRDVHYLLADGPGDGWYVAERYPAVYLTGEWCASDYRPARRARFRAGVSVVCRRGPEERTVTYAKDTPVRYDRRALVDGRLMLRAVDGDAEGWWVPGSQLLAG